MDISKYMTRAPAKLSGLHNRKGRLVEGFDADFVIWNPETEIEINEAMIFHKNKVRIDVYINCVNTFI